jgi:NAD(P)H-quinone oxidoreductase subunit 5
MTPPRVWTLFQSLSLLALLMALLTLVAGRDGALPGVLHLSTLGLGWRCWCSAGHGDRRFSSRYLQGEPGQPLCRAWPACWRPCTCCCWPTTGWC